MSVIMRQPQSVANALGQALGSLAGNTLNQYQQQQQMQQQQSKLSQALQQAQQLWDSPISDEQKIIGLNQLLSNQNPEIAKNIINQIQQSQKQNLPTKQDIEAQETAKVKDRAQNAFNRMAEIVKGKRLGLGSELKSSLIGGKTAQDVGEFQSLSGALEAILVDMVSRGTLSNSRFNYITQTLLPKPGDREDVIKGKMKGLAEVLELDPASLGEKQTPKKTEAKSGFVKLKDPQGIERWVPEDIAKKIQGTK